MRDMVDLVEAASTAGGSPRSCWAQDLPDDLADQLAQVRAMADAGESVNKAAVTRALAEAGVHIGREAVRVHLNRGCICE